MPTVGICQNMFTYSSLGRIGHLGVVGFIVGGLYLLMSLLTITCIKSQEISARRGDLNNLEVKSHIFPIFVTVLWVSVAVGLLSSGVVMVVPLNVVGGNTVVTSLCYAAMKACQHAVIEGIAFLLMQKGCGQYAARTALWWTFSWSIFIFIFRFIIYWQQGTIGDTLELFVDVVIFLFYISLWLCPEKLLFRRPAVYVYARFWVYFRLSAIIVKILFFFQETKNTAACGYYIFTLILFAIFQPLICYWTLLQDSDWWQGLHINQGGRHGSFEEIKAPLLGTDISLGSAQSLACVMDDINGNSRKHVKLINFANIRIDVSKVLGTGSFSKVFKGQYLGNECAIKMIYTLDLTTDVISRVAAEASVLSSMQHPNVVRIYGVAVLPPSVCIVLELCQYGSLSDIIRIDDENLRVSGTKLSYSDRLYLALGCARGLTVVHSCDPSLCHRDVKSFNFLVDDKFHVKIADLELGGQQTPIAVNVSELLPHWLAPEVLDGKLYTQASDVYSLGTVLWEIISGKLPFDDEQSEETIRRKVLSGHTHDIPVEYVGSKYADIITRSWSRNPSLRPSSEKISQDLDDLLGDAMQGFRLKSHHQNLTQSQEKFYDMYRPQIAMPDIHVHIAK